jgi:hypothetical protein
MAGLFLPIALKGTLVAMRAPVRVEREESARLTYSHGDAALVDERDDREAGLWRGQ